VSDQTLASAAAVDAAPSAPLHDVIVVGSGPAGYTAAIYLARAELRPLVFEGYSYGGALMTTTEVENFPGFPQGIQGPELMAQIREQAERFGAELQTVDAESVDLRGPVKTVTVDGVQHRARAVVLATGSAARYLNLPDEQRLIGRGVSACATCDGFFFRNQHIIVVGGGDTAMEEATFLTRFAETVTIVHRRDAFRASKVMAARALNNPKIKVEWNSTVEEILGDDGKVVGARLRNLQTGEVKTLDVTGVFIAIGHNPRSELFKGQVELDDEGYVKVDAPSTRTNLAGVFAAGDLVDHTYRQAITAAGTGTAAALDAERFIASFIEL
jgi:thioredoxin reductase (NADPH)